jgi:hypothetical protein
MLHSLRLTHHFAKYLSSLLILFFNEVKLWFCWKPILHFDVKFTCHSPRRRCAFEFLFSFLEMSVLNSAEAGTF